MALQHVNPIYRLSTEDLNTVTATGTYHQPSNRDATTARHYPDKWAGLLEVHNSGGSMLYQRYTQYTDHLAVYVRGYYDLTNTWSAWKQITLT